MKSRKNCGRSTSNRQMLVRSLGVDIFEDQHKGFCLFKHR